MKIIAVDIGNSMTRLAIVENGTVDAKTTLANEQIGQFPVKLKTLADRLGDQRTIPVVVCSVSPAICKRVASLVELAMDAGPMVIGQEIPIPIELGLSSPAGVGHDRVVSAAMAYHRIRNAVVVADFGTAVTIDCVNGEGVFLCGAILPGLTTAAKALAASTSALPWVKQPKAPATVWGRDTTEAISAGLIFGAAGALREMVERYATELKRWPEIILTGGDADLVAEHCNFVKATVPDLLLMGIELAYERYLECKTGTAD